MKHKTLLGMIVFLLCSAGAWAQVVQNPPAFKTTGAATTVNLKQTGVYNHHLTWTGTGTRTSCTVKLEQSVDGVTWSDLIANQTCTTNNAATTSGYVNYVRINVTTLTGSGNTLYVTYAGTNVVSTVNVDTSTLALESGGNLAGIKALLPTALAANGGFKVEGIAGGVAVPVSPSTADGADGAAMTNNPTPIAGKLNTDGSKAAMPAFTVGGAGFSLPWTATATFWSASVAIPNSTTAVIAGTALNYVYISGCTIDNVDTAVGASVSLQDGSGGTVIYRLPGPTPGASGNVSGGHFPFPIPLKVPTVGNGLYAVASASATTLYLSCHGWKSTVSF